MTMAPPDLFDVPPAPAPAPPARVIGKGIPLRFCQIEDVNAIWHAIGSGHVRPACVAATGYGKGALIAELVGRLRTGGKVLCLVDRWHLVHQLADEIERHLDVRCGRIADGVCEGITRGVVVSTVQAMYTADAKGIPLYEYPQFKSVRAVVIDEGHKFFADCFRSVADHFASEHGAVIAAFTATPVAANGARWASFFDWTPQAEGPCMRTVGWCVRNGYLVPPRQAFVRVNIDLAPIYDQLGNGDTDDEDDAGDASAVLLDLLRDRGERDAAAFARGVVEVIGQRRALMFTPPRRPQAVDAPCKLLAAWLQAAGMPCEAVWGGRADVGDVLAAFKKGTPQSLANVSLLTEGFDVPDISAVFICRVLKQWRLVQQMVGRCLRPSRSIVAELNQHDGPDDAEARRNVIAASVKPDALVADLVGLDGKVLRASAIDVMFAHEAADVRAEMGEIVAKRAGGRERDDATPDEALLEAARSQLLNRQHERLAELARARGMAGGISADVSVSYDGTDAGEELPKLPTPRQVATDGEKARFVAFATQYDTERAKGIADRMSRNQLRGMTAGLEKKNGKPDWARARSAYPEWERSRAHAKSEAANVKAPDPVPGICLEHVGLMRNQGMSLDEIRRMNPAEVPGVLAKFRVRKLKGLCTLMQARRLRDHGFTKAELEGMTQRQAHAELGKLARNNWTRPTSIAGATSGVI